VFSASNYRCDPPNDSGAVSINDQGNLEKIVFPPLPRMAHAAASFYSTPRRRRAHRATCPDQGRIPITALWPAAHGRSFLRNSAAAFVVPHRLVTPHMPHGNTALLALPIAAEVP
jgi:hypothetical protein